MKLALVAALAACGGAAAPAPATPSNHVAAPAPKPTPPAQNAMARMAAFRDQMCACKSGETACAQRVSDAMTAWVQELGRSADKAPAYTEEQTAQFTELAQALGTCMRSAMQSP